jgi:hypothetical protein
VNGEALAEGLVKLQQVYNVLTIWLLEHENPVDVLEHDLVIVGFAVQLAEVAVKVQTVVSPRNQHWQVLNARNYRA